MKTKRTLRQVIRSNIHSGRAVLLVLFGGVEEELGLRYHGITPSHITPCICFCLRRTYLRYGHDIDGHF